MKRPGPGQVDLWFAGTAACSAPELRVRYEAMLDAAELARMRAFRFPEHRLENLVSRVLCRTVLAAYEGTSAEGLRFMKNAWGKPRLDPAGSVDFNLTNHPSLVALAVTGGATVGVDLEPFSRGDDVIEVADSVFSERELRELRALPTVEARRLRAIDLWTGKEAYIKARGMGLSLPLADITMVFDDPGATRLALGAAVEDPDARWRFEQLDEAGHRVSLCVAGAPEVPLEVNLRRVVPLLDRLG